MLPEGLDRPLKHRGGQHRTGGRNGSERIKWRQFEGVNATAGDLGQEARARAPNRDTADQPH